VLATNSVTLYNKLLIGHATQC